MGSRLPLLKENNHYLSRFAGGHCSTTTRVIYCSSLPKNHASVCTMGYFLCFGLKPPATATSHPYPAPATVANYSYSTVLCLQGCHHLAHTRVPGEATTEHVHLRATACPHRYRHGGLSAIAHTSTYRHPSLLPSDELTFLPIQDEPHGKSSQEPPCTVEAPRLTLLPWPHSTSQGKHAPSVVQRPHCLQTRPS